MPTFEHNTLRHYKDQNGDMHLDYPITKAENVVGLYGDAGLTGVPTAPTAASGTSTTQIATTEFVQTELSDIKKELSDGMTDVAAAITEKGVETATDATLAVMAANIRSISSGGNGVSLNIFTQLEEPDIKDGIWVKTGSKYEKIIIDNRVLQENGMWVEYNDLPLSFAGGYAEVYHGKIHLIINTNHYSFDGISWIVEPSCPTSVQRGASVVWNDEIHLLSSVNGSYHYKYNGVSWTKVSTTGLLYGGMTVFNNEMHILSIGGTSGSYYHRKFNPDTATWIDDVRIPESVYYGHAFTKDGCIHLIAQRSNNVTSTCHYTFNGTSWTALSNPPIYVPYSSDVLHNNQIYLIGGGVYNKCYKWDANTWTLESVLPWNVHQSPAVSKDDSIIVFSGSDTSTEVNTKKRATFKTPEKLYDPKTLILQKANAYTGKYLTVIADTSLIIGDCNRFASSFDDAYYFDESSFDWDAPMYYGDGTQWVKFKN